MAETKILPVDGFLRQQENPGAIINVDNNGLKAYKQRRQAENARDSEINSLKQEISELKDLLKQVLEKKNK